MMRGTLAPVGVMGLLLLLLLAGCGAPPNPAPTREPPQPVTREAIVFATEIGNITVMLYPEAAPETVALMKRYVEEGYYNGRAFYRTVPGHVIQVTDAAGGATDDNTTVPLEVSPQHHFAAGAVGTARGEDPHSGGPEFFVMDFATSHLDGNYTVWGQVVEGMDYVRIIARSPAVAAPALPAGTPNPFPFDRMATDPVAITSTSLVEITLSGLEAAQYPLEVARNVRVGDYRHSLEWPRDLAAGDAYELRWFVRPYGEDPVPLAEHVRIQVDGQQLIAGAAADAPGAFRFVWAPDVAGWHTLTIAVDGVPWASLQAWADERA